MPSHHESRQRREQHRLHREFLRIMSELLRLIELREKARLLREKGFADAPSDTMIREAMRPLVERIEATRTELDRLAVANDLASAAPAQAAQELQSWACWFVAAVPRSAVRRDFGSCNGCADYALPRQLASAGVGTSRR